MRSVMLWFKGQSAPRRLPSPPSFYPENVPTSSDGRGYTALSNTAGPAHWRRLGGQQRARAHGRQRRPGAPAAWFAVPPTRVCARRGRPGWREGDGEEEEYRISRACIISATHRPISSLFLPWGDLLRPHSLSVFPLFSCPTHARHGITFPYDLCASEGSLPTGNLGGACGDGSFGSSCGGSARRKGGCGEGTLSEKHGDGACAGHEVLEKGQGAERVRWDGESCDDW